MSGCGQTHPSGTTQETRTGDAAWAEGVVSRVNGHEIRLSEVRQVVARTGHTPREALRRLQARWLLFEEAERRAILPDAAGRIATRKMLVQAWLVGELESVVISDDEVRAAYDAQKARFHPPERRASEHILATVDPSVDETVRQRARRFASQAVGWLADLPFEAAARHAQELGRGAPFAVKAQEVPATPRNGGLSKAYLEALFAQAGPGVVPFPVESRYGFHAIKVTKVLHPEPTSLARARAVLLPELQRERRQELLDELLAKLARQVPVVRHAGNTAVLGEIRL